MALSPGSKNGARHRARLLAAITLAGSVLSAGSVAGTTSRAAASPDEVGFGIFEPIFVDRDFKVIDLDGDGVYDWLNHSPDNTNLRVGPPPGYPDAVGTPRFEWDLSSAEIEAMRSTRVILDISSSNHHRAGSLVLSVAGTNVLGLAGGTHPSPGGVGWEQIKGTDVTAAVHAWIDAGANGPLRVDLLESSQSVLTQEFSGNRHLNAPSPPRIFLREPTAESAESVTMTSVAGPWRNSSHGLLDDGVWTLAPTMAERNTLAAADKVELQIRRASCPSGANGNDLLAFYNQGLSLRRSGGQNAQTVAHGLESVAVVDRHIYVDVTDYVQSNMGRANSIGFALVGADGAVSCKFLMNSFGDYPWHAAAETKIVLNGERSAAMPQLEWKNGTLGSCSVRMDASGAIEVTTSVSSPEVHMDMHRRGNSYLRWTGGLVADWSVGTFLDFGTGSEDGPVRYRAVFSDGEHEEVVICGMAIAKPIEYTMLLEETSAQLDELVAQHLVDGDLYAAWDSTDPNTRSTVRIVVKLSDLDTVVASRGAAPLDQAINPFTSHDELSLVAEDLYQIKFSQAGAVLGWSYNGPGGRSARSEGVWYGTSPDEMLDREPLVEQGSWWFNL